MLLVDGLFNKGKGSEDILPSSYEKAMESQQKQIIQKSKYQHNTVQWTVARVSVPV